MYFRDRIYDCLHKLNINSNSPVQSFAAFFLGRLFYKQYSLGNKQPDLAIIQIRPFLDQSGILDILSMESICACSDDWMRFGRLIEKMNGIDYINLMHPCYIHNPDTDFDVETIPNGINEEKLYKLLLLYFMIAEDSRFDPLLPDNINHKAFELYRQKFKLFGVDQNDYFDTIEGLFYSHLEEKSVKLSSAIKKLYKNYQKKGFTKQQLLSDYALFKYHGLSPSHFAFDDAQVERGLSKEEENFRKLFENCCSSFQPTAMIHTLFYHVKRDDHPFEVAFLIPKIRHLCRRLSSALIVNPSPFFLEQCGVIQNEIGLKVTVAVSDDTICDIYKEQFPAMNFLPCVQLAALRERFDFVLVIARDLEYQHYADAFARCDRNCHLIYFGPETALCGANPFLMHDLIRLDIVPDTVISVAREATASIGRKKVVLFARKAEIHSADHFLLLTSFVRDSFFYIDRTSLPIPRDWLKDHMTLAQMQAKFFKYADETREHYEEPRIYHFSQEISLYYVPLQRSDCVSAKVCYRAVLSGKGKDRRRRRGKNLTGFSEKGMRCPSFEQLPEGLEKITLEPQFYGVICDDIRKNYPGSPLSLKTLWYLCREHLRSVVPAYKDEEMDLFFRNCSGKIRDLIPSEMTGDEIAQVLEEECGEDAWKLLEQFHLIFIACVDYGYLAKVPLGEQYSLRLANGRNRLQEIRDNLSKHFFTPEEEQRILQFLMEPQGRKKTAKCVAESCYLTGLIRLYTGMPLREVLGLRWQDLYQDPDTGAYSMVITGRVNNDGKRIDFDPIRNRWKFRVVPLHPALTTTILLRRRWLLEQSRFSEEEIMDQPIVLALEPNRNRRKCAWNHCSIDYGRKLTGQVLQAARIPPNKIKLLEGDQQFDHDLNAVKRDLFYGNFLHRTIYTCGFTMGQRCYVTGVEPPDTFSAHYVDFANPLVQHQMIRKLARWGIGPASIDTDIPVWRYQLIRNEGAIQAEGIPDLVGQVEMDVILDDRDDEMILILDTDQAYRLQISRFRMGGLCDEKTAK